MAIAARESGSKNLMSTIIPQKGEDIEWPSTQIAYEIDQMGYKRLIIRSVPEPAVTAFAKEVKRKSQRKLSWRRRPGAIRTPMVSQKGVFKTRKDNSVPCMRTWQKELEKIFPQSTLCCHGWFVMPQI